MGKGLIFLILAWGGKGKGEKKLIAQSKMKGRGKRKKG